jgi:hypothetical protein
MLGLFATAFLAGAMRSVAKYNANFNNKSLMVAGPAVSTNLTISLFRTIDKISINGKVILLKKQTGIPGAEIRFEGMDSTFFTDQFGNFEAELPVKTGAEVRVIISKGADIIYNSVRILADKALLTFPVS